MIAGLMDAGDEAAADASDATNDRDEDVLDRDEIPLSVLDRAFPTEQHRHSVEGFSDHLLTGCGTHSVAFIGLGQGAADPANVAFRFPSLLAFFMPAEIDLQDLGQPLNDHLGVAHCLAVLLWCFVGLAQALMVQVQRCLQLAS